MNRIHLLFHHLVVLLVLSIGDTLAQSPIAVRNDVARPRGEEFLVLRHQFLKKGTHERFFEISRAGVWPYFEKIGSRTTGQWQVIHPEGGGADEYDEGYRLARYVDYTHWKDTRTAETMSGDGPDREAFLQALRDRNKLKTGSKHVWFLQGNMAPGGPYHLPGTGETFERIESPRTTEPDPAKPLPVRNDIAQPGREIVSMRYWKIKKNSFPEFNAASVNAVWPFFEKIGARLIGQWKVVYPAEGAMKENADYDEVIMLTRYASYEHWKATRNSAELGGNGPDYDAMRQALKLRRSLTIETNVQFLQGHLYQSPPKFLPGLRESYRKTE